MFNHFFKLSILSLSFFLIGILFGCSENVKKENEIKEMPTLKTETLFNLLPSSITNVSFENTLTNNPYGNILMYQYFYNGGGVAAGDVDNDGLPDLYFTGNMVPNALYLNKGEMKFDDVTATAAVSGKKASWATGVAMADVNGDNLLDIYVCYSGHMPGYARANELFINQGIDSTGNIRFLEQASQYNLADSGYSTSASFFDYDNDGDLDMLLLNHNILTYNNLDEYSIKEIMQRNSPDMRTKLYRNDNNFFTEVSDEAGLAGSPFNYSLGAGIADINLDGWQDIYISNDYSAPDYLYINNGDGTFTDQLKTGMQHTSLYSMGNDIADINNDGLPDIYTLDMLPEDNKRQKLLFTPDNYEYFKLFVQAGFSYQYMRNMLHINNGNGTFSEIGQLAGISNTDWSWAPLFGDYDNDGFKDLFVSNGFLRDFTNLDFIKYKSSFYQNTGNLNEEKVLGLVDEIPSSNVSNYIYKNNGDLTFSNTKRDWGLTEASNSNGAAYADLDNDGDLDLIVNNINAKPFIYENQSDKRQKNNFLKIKLEGLKSNTSGIGAKVWVFSEGNQQYQELVATRGYQSSVPPDLHFGLAEAAIVDSLRVVWLSGKQQVLNGVAANQLLLVKESDANKKYIYSTSKNKSPILQPTSSQLDFKHAESPYNDFKRQPLLINPLSFSGPCMANADVDGDGLSDIFIGGAQGQAAVLYMQRSNGSFYKKELEAFDADKRSEDVSALFVDVNNDGLPDLYVGSGGYNDFLPQDNLLQDRLYINQGKGNFIRSAGLPVMLTSTGCVAASDINNDGYQDFFVGGRVIPGRYPETPRSYVLINDKKGNFIDATEKIAPELRKAGMVTDAAWHDIDGNGADELIVVGEWMPISIYKQENGKLIDDTPTYFSSGYRGWWNKILIDDFDMDGVSELIVGNMGLNTQVKVSEDEPAELYFDDFDNNGSIDPILSFFVQGKSYPYVTRDELLSQMSFLRTVFPNYESYSESTIEGIFTKEALKQAGHLSANYLKTVYFKRDKRGKFGEMSLPIQAQFSPIQCIISFDYNEDGHKDILLCGNINKARLRFGKYDANYGILLKGDGKGGFEYIPQYISGLELIGDVRSVIEINNLLLFGINQQEIKAYKITESKAGK